MATSLKVIAGDHRADDLLRINKARISISGGRSLAIALRDQCLAEPFDTSLITLGEKHGRLEFILLNLARRYEQRTERLRRVKSRLRCRLWFLFSPC